MNSFIEVKNLKKSFNGKLCLNIPELSINRGEFLLIAGANGSGKTLFMKHLNGLFKLKRDSILIDGVDYFKNEKELPKKIGIVFQNPDTQLIGLTVEDDIKFGPTNLGLSSDKISTVTTEAINSMDISHLTNLIPHNLSGGEKKRVTIAGILAMSPEVIILDEPFIGLDYKGVKDVTKAILKLKDMGKTVILITHDLEKIAAYVTRTVIMFNGEIVFNGKLSDSLDRLENWDIRKPIQNRIEDMTWLK